MLTQALIFLTVTVVAIPIFQRLGLGAVLGYLLAGAAVGPSGLGFIADPHDSLAIGEFGVVFMLFVIGLGLQPSRLWQMRLAVFGFGGLQVIVTGGLIALIAHFGFLLPLNESVMVGGALALSSTALGLKLLADRDERVTPHGRLSFSILLFQDLAAIPLIAFAPLLGDAAPMGRRSTDSLSPPYSWRSSSRGAISCGPPFVSCRWRGATRSRRPRPSCWSSGRPS